MFLELFWYMLSYMRPLHAGCIGLCRLSLQWWKVKPWRRMLAYVMHAAVTLMFWERDRTCTAHHLRRSTILRSYTQSIYVTFLIVEGGLLTDGCTKCLSELGVNNHASKLNTLLAGKDKPIWQSYLEDWTGKELSDPWSWSDNYI